MKASKSSYFSQSVVLSGEDLKVIVNQVREVFGRITIEAGCSDGVSRSFDNIEELLSYENYKETEISSLSLRGYSLAAEGAIRLEFSRRQFYNITYRIDADSIQFEKLHKFIESRVRAMRPWYWFFSPNNIWGISIIALMVASLNLIITRIASKIMPPLSLGTKSLVVVIVLSTLVGIIWNQALYRVFARFFPVAVFAWNQGSKRHQDLDYIRTVVVIALIIEIVTGILISVSFAG